MEKRIFSLKNYMTNCYHISIINLLKKRLVCSSLKILLILIFCFNSITFAQTASPPPDTAQPEIKKISKNEYAIGAVRLNKQTRELRMPGVVNMDSGIVELLACVKGGKVHESVLVIDIIPHHLQVALLLLGLEYHGDLEYQGDPRQPKGDSVEVWVEWKSKGKVVRKRGEDLIYDIPKKRSMPHTPWVFTGSRVINGVFQADVQKSIITTYHDPYTIIDNPLPEGGDDTVYEVNESIVPPRGTKVVLIIKPYRL
jgi:hypothetical protein